VVNDALRERLTSYALRLARAINYVNAGTFEFLVVPANSPSPATEGSRERGPGGEGPAVYFLEVNPRLQVEHPVTEMVTGLDLVELQLRIAAGEPLPLKQEDVKFEGHAIEFRINAEDPSDGFKPSSGRIVSAHWGETARCDRGYEDGDVVPPNYDSLAGKVIVHADSRDDAIDFSADELVGATSLTPLRTNVPLLEAIRSSSAFRRGHAHIAWLEQELPTLMESARTPTNAWLAAAAALAAGNGFVGVASQSIWLDDGCEVKHIGVKTRGREFDAATGGLAAAGRVERAVAVDEVWHREVDVRLAGERFAFRIAPFGVFGGTEVTSNAGFNFIVVQPPPLPRRVHAAAEGVTAITAPLAGTIAAVRAAEGDSVAEGQLLLVLEAMKMEHRIAAPSAGTVKSLRVRERDVVREGDTLIELA